MRERSPLRIPTPKQARRSERWYPYYAGCSSPLVRDIVALFSEPQSVAFDSWTGPGTTTVLAADAGLAHTVSSRSWY